MTETIAAIATAMSNSGIGIIRISGEEAIDVLERIFEPKDKNKKIKEVKSHTIHYGYLVDCRKEKKEVVDEVLVSVMRAPHTYTRENVVEINCHGGVTVMSRALELVLASGARPAEPGEFTKRAFLNGRIDLSQAEAVMDVIQAKNEFALKSSVTQLKGSISTKIKELRDKLLNHIAYIEAALDDPEHISMDGYEKELDESCAEIQKQLKSLIDNFNNGRIRKEGIQTVILGKPNAGKSSLLNILIGEERAIVTDIEGTTRDTLEESINLNGITLNIVDTAGIRKTEDVVEKIGVDKAISHAKDADLIVFVVDASRALDENDKNIIKLIQDKKAIVLLNKSDLDIVTDAATLEQLCSRTVIPISAKENTGISEFEEQVKKMFYNQEISFNDEIYITNARQKQDIEYAYESITAVRKSIGDGMPEDFYTIDLMDGYEKLGLVIGEAVEDDLVDRIFSKFCMGK